MESNDSKDLRYEKLKDINGMACIAFSWIIALIMIGIFVRLVHTNGAPAWFICVHGILTVLAIVAVIFLVRLGMFRAVKEYLKSRREKAVDND